MAFCCDNDGGSQCGRKLLINPYERLDRFGDNANINMFTLNTTVTLLYKRVKSRPHPHALTDEQRKVLENEKSEKEKQVSTAFLQYLASTGVFSEWETDKETFHSLHGNDPVMFWHQLLTHNEVAELADFAILLLTIVLNQGGSERDFSDLKIKKTQHRNRLTLPRLEKMSKVSIEPTRHTLVSLSMNFGTGGIQYSFIAHFCRSGRVSRKEEQPLTRACCAAFICATLRRLA